MGRPKKVKDESEVVGKKVGKETHYTPVQELSEREEAALTKEKPSSPAGTLEGKELPKVSQPEPKPKAKAGPCYGRS
jgi:hypothetical protein